MSLDFTNELDFKLMQEWQKVDDEHSPGILIEEDEQLSYDTALSTIPGIVHEHFKGKYTLDQVNGAWEMLFSNGAL